MPGVTIDADYQLLVEDASAVADHDIVVFADAAVDGAEPFSFRRLEARDDATFSTHSVSPEGVLHLARKCFSATTRGYVLGIRGYEFNEFGEGLSPQARENLDAAATFLKTVVCDGGFDEAADAFDADAVGQNGPRESD